MNQICTTKEQSYNEKFRFEEENPDQEVIFVKVIKRRNKYGK